MRTGHRSEGKEKLWYFLQIHLESVLILLVCEGLLRLLWRPLSELVYFSQSLSVSRPASSNSLLFSSCSASISAWISSDNKILMILSENEWPSLTRKWIILSYWEYDFCSFYKNDIMILYKWIWVSKKIDNDALFKQRYDPLCSSINKNMIVPLKVRRWLTLY